MTAQEYEKLALSEDPVTDHEFDCGPWGNEWQCAHEVGRSPYGSPLLCNRIRQDHQPAGDGR